MIANVRFIDRALRIEVGEAQNAAAALVGSAVFGVGWSIAWFCPGRAPRPGNWPDRGRRLRAGADRLHLWRQGPNGPERRARSPRAAP